MKVAFRTDASLCIGTGHVMRCKTLADELRAKGVEIRFFCRELPGNLVQMLCEAGYPTTVLPAPASSIATTLPSPDDYAAWLGVEQSEDAAQMLDALGDYVPDWLVVDHYGLDVTWERILHPKVGRIFVIDDLANRPHDCDMLLDQNLYVGMESRYTDLVPPHARQLLGPRFALLRPEFRKARETLCWRDGTVRRILVSFGGVDPTRETEKVLEALQELNRMDIAVDVVVGDNNPRADVIRAKCGGLPNVTFHCQISNMAALMAAADFSFGAGGSSHWERCSVGVPTAVTVTSANQSGVTRDLAASNVVLALGSAAEADSARYQSVLDSLTKEQLVALQSASLALVDGRGSDRVTLSLCDVAVQLRRATAEDADKAWSWRNHPITRKSSLNYSDIALADHLAWWRRSLSDSSRILLVGARYEVEIGVLRYDLVKEDRAVVSIYLDPELHGLGQGVALLKAGQIWLIEHFPDVRDIEATILSDNEASRRAFAAVGFQLQRDVWIWRKDPNSKQKKITSVL